MHTKSATRLLLSFWTMLAIAAAPAAHALPAPPAAPIMTPVPSIKAWVQPARHPRAIAVLLHGITASAASLDRLAEALEADGVWTYGMDLRGHGAWYFKTQPGTTGHRCDYQSSVGDAESLVAALRRDHPAAPIFLVGESVGSAVALRAAVHCKGMIDGLVLCAPGSQCARANPLWVLSDVLRACTFHKINLARYQMRYGTEDQIALPAMVNSPNIRKIYSARELLGTVRFIHKNPQFARQLDPQIPVLVLQGDADETITPNSALAVFRSLASMDKHFIAIPKCGHVLLATPRLKPVVRDSIVGFVNSQTTKREAIAKSRELYE